LLFFLYFKTTHSYYYFGLLHEASNKQSTTHHNHHQTAAQIHTMSQKKLHLLMFCVASCTLAACFQTFPLPKAHRHPSMVDRHRQVKKSVAYLCQSNGCNDNGDAPINIISSRRRILFQVATTLSILSTNPSLSFAAAPITSKEADNFQAKLQRLLRPKPPKALRPKLDQDFAVLLMRSSYNALDQLDVVAMVRFWVIFF